jgi:hypothetical protein
MFKRKNMKRLLSLCFAIFLVVITSCRTSKITHSWKAQEASPKKYTKILVLGFIRNADRNIEEQMENHFVGDLQTLGYNAVSSLKEYGPKVFDKIDENEGIAKLKNSGYDAVITIVLLKNERERKYIPPTYNNRMWNYRYDIYNRIYEPGYYVTSTKYYWESNFYDMANQKLMYSVQTQTFAPNDAESMGHEYGKMIVKNMVNQDLLKQQVIVSKISNE